MDRNSRQVLVLSRIEQLSDDVLLLIMFFLPSLSEIARTSILSQRWRNIWHNIAYLDFDSITLLPNKRLAERYYPYIALVNQVISIPRLSLVKGLCICYPFKAMDGLHINAWIDFAIANRVETLKLDLYLISYDQRYNLTEECWYRAPSGLSSLNCLKSLVLSSVHVSKKFVEFILSSCPLLEEFSLAYAGTFSNVDISGLRLKRLRIEHVEGHALKKLYAPHLTSFFFLSYSSGFNPQKIDTPMLTDLTIGGKFGSQSIKSYLKHFRHYLPQLEKLDLIIGKKQRFKLKKIPELPKLKYLKMRFYIDTDPILHRIIKSLNAFPVLETFVIEIPADHVTLFPRETMLNRMRKLYGDSVCDKSIMLHNKKQERLRRKAERSCPTFECLKVLELVGREKKLIDQEVVKFILNQTPNLNKLNVMIDTRFLNQSSKLEMMEFVRAKAIELCHARVEIIIGENCRKSPL